MFTWICPQCGKEVPPAYTDCPNCAEKAKSGQQAQAPPASGAEPATPPPYAPPPPYQAPPQPFQTQQYQQQTAPPPPYQPPYQPPQHQQQYPPPPPYNYPPQQQQQYAPPPPYNYPPPPHKRGLPTWLLTILVAGGTAAVIFGAIWLFSNHGETKPSATVESPAAKPGAAVNPIQRNIEVSGLRFEADPKNKSKVRVKFEVTNHSGMDLPGLAGNVTMWGSTRKSEEDAQGTFTFSTNLRPYESKELEAPLTTKFKIYEMPDWQNLNPDVQITAPVVSGGSGGR